MPSDLAGEGEPVHLRHQEVEHREVELLASLDEGERLGRALDRNGFHVPRARVPGEDLAVRRVVVHDEDPLARELRQRALVCQPRRNLGSVHVELDVEARAFVHLALDSHRPSHELDESLRDREPETGAAVAAGGGGVALAE